MCIQLSTRVDTMAIKLYDHMNMVFHFHHGMFVMVIMEDSIFILWWHGYCYKVIRTPVIHPTLIVSVQVVIMESWKTWWYNDYALNRGDYAKKH